MRHRLSEDDVTPTPFYSHPSVQQCLRGRRSMEFTFSDSLRAGPEGMQTDCRDRPRVLGCTVSYTSHPPALRKSVRGKAPWNPGVWGVPEVRRQCHCEARRKRAVAIWQRPPRLLRRLPPPRNNNSHAYFRDGTLGRREWKGAGAANC